MCDGGVDLDKMTLGKLLSDWPTDPEFEEFEGLLDFQESLTLRKKSKSEVKNGEPEKERVLCRPMRKSSPTRVTRTSTSS